MATLTFPKRDEDLFEDTAMSFGEHLDELRTALFKALLGLVIGVMIGLFFADRVVDLLQRPLTKALVEYYTGKAVDTFHALIKECEVEQKPLPAYTEAQVKRLMIDHSLLFEVQYAHPQVIADQLGLEIKHSGDAVKERANPPATDSAKPAEGVPAAEEVENPIISYLALQPLILWHRVSDDARISIRALNPSEGFSIWMKAGLVAGAIISSPWVFYHIWAFVAAGLYPHEKRYVHIFLPFSLGLFLLGAATAYLFVFGPVLDFLFGFNKSMGIDPDLRISELVGFVLLLPLGFGISFQLPLVMLFLERIGVFDIRGYLEKWRIAVLVIFILSAILTPADPYSLLLMALPLCVLYFGGIGLCRLMPRRTLLDA